MLEYLQHHIDALLRAMISNFFHSYSLISSLCLERKYYISSTSIKILAYLYLCPLFSWGKSKVEFLADLTIAILVIYCNKEL